jgi:hypothetical protein
VSDISKFVIVHGISQKGNDVGKVKEFSDLESARNAFAL